MFHLLRAALNPTLGLRPCVENWAAISQRLREPPRQRTTQTEEMEKKVLMLS